MATLAADDLHLPGVALIGAVPLFAARRGEAAWRFSK
jgi:hypothetical protein